MAKRKPSPLAQAFRSTMKKNEKFEAVLDMVEKGVGVYQACAEVHLSYDWFCTLRRRSQAKKKIERQVKTPDGSLPIGSAQQLFGKGDE